MPIRTARGGPRVPRLLFSNKSHNNNRCSDTMECRTIHILSPMMNWRRSDWTLFKPVSICSLGQTSLHLLSRTPHRSVFSQLLIPPLIPKQSTLALAQDDGSSRWRTIFRPRASSAQTFRPFNLPTCPPMPSLSSWI